MRDQTSSLSRALTLLDAFSRGDPDLSLKEIADRAGMPKSTAHRLVRDLITWGALERTAKGLRLGMRLFELGQLVPEARVLRDVALPFMEEIHRITRKTVNLAIRAGLEVVYVEKLVASDFSVPHSRAGGRLPIHCTALGKAILAYSPPSVIDDVIGLGLARLTSQTIVNAAVLRAELSHIRRERVAYDIGESWPGINCVAAPLLKPDGEALAALSISCLQNGPSIGEYELTIRTVSALLSRMLADKGRPRSTK